MQRADEAEMKYSDIPMCDARMRYYNPIRRSEAISTCPRLNATDIGYVRVSHGLKKENKRRRARPG